MKSISDRSATKKAAKSDEISTHSFEPVLEGELLGFLVLGQTLADLQIGGTIQRELLD